MHRRHHALQHGVQELAGLLGIAIGQQLHRALEVGKQHRDLLALAFEGCFRGQDLLGEMCGGVYLRCLGSRCEWWGCDGRGRPGQRGAAVIAEDRTQRGFAATRGARRGGGSPAGRTKAGALTVLILTMRAAHGSPLCAQRSTGRQPGRARANASTRTIGTGVVNGVSVLHTWPGVKRKARGPASTEVQERGGHTAGLGTVMVVMEGYGARPVRVTVTSFRSKVAKSLRFRTCGRLYVVNTLLERLAQPFEDMPLALRPFIQKQDPVVGPRHLPRHRHRPAADQAGSRDGVMGGAVACTSTQLGTSRTGCTQFHLQLDGVGRLPI
jgi:hypothetical protein